MKAIFSSIRLRTLIALVLWGIFSAPASFAASASSIAIVNITKFAFTPKEITVAPGTTVRWVNQDETPHTVTSQDKNKKVLASKALDTDDQFEFVFTKEGDYPYFCTVHPFMTGIVHVRKAQ